MNELYWITRFGVIASISRTLFIFGMIVSVIALIIYYVNKSTSINYRNINPELSEEYTRYYGLAKGFLKFSSPITLISLIIMIFTPTTKEAMLIYGVGGTIDYLKENPTAKQIPNKCINALDKWVDSWTPDSIKH